MGRILNYIHRLIRDDDELQSISLGRDAYGEMIDEWKEEGDLSDDDNVHDPIIGGVRLFRDDSLDPDEIVGS